MKIDISSEIIFSTARSGGSGGQNVNKVETMVEGRWYIAGSLLVTHEQKATLTTKLANKITSEGMFLVKSQTERTQLGNKQQVIKKMGLIVNAALVPDKKRIATKPSKAAKEKRIEGKKQLSKVKETRKKIKLDKL